jgi:hypothetical protein
VRHLHQPLRDLPAHAVHPIGHDERSAGEGRLQRDGAGFHERCGREVKKIPWRAAHWVTGVGEKLRGQVGRTADPNLNVRATPGDFRCSGLEEIQVPVNLLGSRPGKEAEDGSAWVEPLLSAPLHTRDARLRNLQQRAADELRIRALGGEEIGFEGKNHSDPPRVPREIACPAGVPCPDLGSDVIQNGRAAPGGVLREPEIEARIIDRNHEIHPLSRQRFEHLPPEPEEERQASDHLREAHHGEVVEPGEQLDARRLHAVAAEADQANTWKTRTERTRERRSVEITRRLTCREEDGPSLLPALCCSRFRHRVRRSGPDTR